MLRVVLITFAALYSCIVLYHDFFGPKYMVWLLIAISAIIPVVINRAICRKSSAGFISFFVTPSVICAILFTSDFIARPAQSWFPLSALWVLAITFPIWMISNIVSVVTEPQS